MNKKLFFTLLLLVFVSAPVLFTSCNSCSDRRAGDLDKLPGVYRGEATIVLPDHVKNHGSPRGERHDTGRSHPLRHRDHGRLERHGSPSGS